VFHIDENGEACVAPEDSLLDQLEDLLSRMIRGVFRFTFVRLPREVYEAVIRWFPTAVKLLKVLGLLAAWLLLTFGPVAWVLGNGAWVSPDVGPPLAWYYAHRTPWDVALCLWSAVAIIGSVWGVARLRRKGRLPPIDSKNARVYDKRAAAYRQANQLDLALVDATEAIRLDPESASAYARRGEVRRMMNQPEEALADLDEAIRLDPSYARAYRSRGEVYAQMGDTAKARADQERADQLNPVGANR
jgi:tetratricopeptide (TPR) repeat protein